MLWKMILSSLFLIFSFPNFNLSFLAFIGFVPLFFAIEDVSPKRAFLISYISGFIFYLGTLYWLYHVTAVGLVILCLYLALYFGAFGWILTAAGFRIRPYIFLIPLIWVILEYIQAHLFTGFGWALLGYSQYKNLPLIQIADFSGVFGVSYVIMMVNYALYRALKKSFFEIVLAGLALSFVIGYGVAREDSRGYSGAVRISVIQGNIPQELKWDPDSRDMIMEKYSALTKTAALDYTDLIIWPETSFPGFFEIDKDMTDRVLNLAKEIRIPILLGVNNENDSMYFNSAVMISRRGNPVARYDKIHLVPFGEYVPFSRKFPGLHKLVLGELGEFTPGSKYILFKLDLSPSTKVNFAALVCFEDVFPELSRQFVKDGAKFLVVLTNDAWYGRSGAAYQHTACSVFRAIENRVPVVRCANTGVSCFIDSRGKIYDSVEEKGSHLFVTGYKTSILNIRNLRAF
ncbi:MAG: apolipoprotein N-acyltransferase [Candidatus Omnitrophota bacterium]|nr:apolipoprotein N-acyltransferase [Candidatus Omnitrophota bacterium]